MKKLTIIAFAAVAGASQAVVLHNNGPFITNPTGGAGGLAISELTAPRSIFGYGMQQTASNAVADDFTTDNAWLVQGFTLYSYQTGATGFTFTNVAWQIMQGNVNTGTMVASGSGAPGNGGFQAYRVLNTGTTATNRPIFGLEMTGLNVQLAANTSYWLRWSVAGTVASGPWQPPVTPRGNVNNAHQFTTVNGSFLPIVDPGDQLGDELPFLLHGVVPEPASILALSAGIAAIVARRRRK